ncbi:MAG TPA: hypothetical protein VMR54_02040 [Thermoanaerobaculia bacterium]|nr:hypothetical protein [Thermoanaerobaculia bacterium]
MGRLIAAAALMLLRSFALPVTPEPAPAAAAFKKLCALAGEWEGSVQWSGARHDSGRMHASYSLTGVGSAVVETLTMDGTPIMTSVYHLDGGDLRMTHYCGARNQPRLKARRIDVVQGILDFEFVDITNLSSSEAGHVSGVEIRLLDADRFILTFLFEEGGQKSRERIELARVPPKRST